MATNFFSFFSKQRLSASVLKNLTSDILTFLEQLPTAVVLVGQGGKIALVNPAAVDLLQREAADLVGADTQAVLGISEEQLTAWQTENKRHLVKVKDAKNNLRAVQVSVKTLGTTGFITVTLEALPFVEQLQTEIVFLHTVLNNYPGAVTVQDASGRCLFCNELAGKLIGKPVDQIKEKVIYQLLPKTLSALVYGLDEELKAGKARQEPARWTSPDGKILSITKQWFADPGQEGRFIVTFYEDSTTRLSHEQDLERSQKLLQAILENISLGLYTRDCDKKVTFINRQGLRILNETPSSLEQKHAFQAQEESDAYALREQQILQDGQTYEYPKEEYVDSSGKKRIVHIIKVPLLDAGPKPLVLTIVEDITKRCEQEQEIQRVSNFFSAVVHNAPIALYARSEDGRMLLRNKQCDLLFGQSQDGNYDERGGLPHESDEQVQGYINREREILQKGKTIDIPEEEYINAQGERKLLHIIKTPVPENRCVITLAEDITFKKEQERALIDSKNFLQTVVNQLPVSLSVKNYDGKYILWNKKSEDLFGVSAKEVIGRNAYRTDLNKEQMEFIRETDLRVFESKKEQNIPQELISSPKEGIKIMHTVKTPVFDADGTPNCLLIVSEDITAKTKMEKQIREANDKNTLLVENAREGVVIVEDAKIIYANHAFCRLVGREKLEDVKDKALLDYVSDSHRVFLKEKYDAVRSGADNSSSEIEVHFQRPDGTKHEAHFSAVLAKYLGRRVVLGFVRDITSDNHALRELKNERDNFRQAFEKSTWPSFILSAKGYISLLNAAGRELFGFSEADKKFYRNVYVRPAIPMAIRKKLKAGLPAQLDYTLDFDKVAAKFPGRITKTGKLPLHLSFEPLAKRDTKDGLVEAEYLVCIQSKEDASQPTKPSTPPTRPQTPAPDPQPTPEAPVTQSSAASEEQTPSFAKTAASATSLPPLPPFLTPKHTSATQTRWVLPSSEPYALCNEQFVITDCNDLLCSLCQLGADELKGQDIRHLFLQDENPLVKQDFNSLQKEGKLTNREYTIQLGSGLETCKVRLTAVKQEDGTFLFVLRSLAFHLQIMKILEERSAQLSALRMATNGAILRLSFNDRKLGKIEQLNNWLSQRTGYPHEELADKDLTQLFFDPSQEDQSAAFVVAKAQEQLASSGKASFHLPVRNKDDSTFEAQVVLTLLDIPMRNEVLAVITDLTAQQNAWGKETKEAQELSTLRQALPGLYLRVDATGKVLEVSSNLAGITSAQAQEMFLGHVPQDFWPEEAASRALFTIKEVLSVHASSHFEFEWTVAGKKSFYEVEVSALEHSPEAVLWVKDVSEKRMYDRRLYELYRLAQETGLSMTEQVEKMLALGNEIFQAEVGLVLRFEPRKDHLSGVVLYASANDLQLERHMEFPIEECLRDVADGNVVLTPNLEGFFCKRCLHREKQFGALLAAPLVVDGKVEGALCFAARQSRHHFLPGAEEILGLMARLLALRIELRQADKLLGAAARIFTRTLDEVQVPALRVDPDFLITYVNEPFVRWTNCSRESVMGQDLFAHLMRHEEIAKRMVLDALHHASGTQGSEVKLEVRLASGIYQEIPWEVFACRNSHGEVEGYALIAHEVHEPEK